MSILMVNEYADFNMLKDLLDVTDGNLPSHTKALETAEYIKVEKQFIARKPNTRYSTTKLGELEFKKQNSASDLLDKFDKYGIEEIVKVGRKNVCE